MSEHLQEEENLGKAYDWRILKRLWRYVAPYRLQVLGTLALVAPLFLVELAPAWIIKTGLDRATGAVPQGVAAWGTEFLQPPSGLHPFAWFGLLYFVAVLIGAALQFANMLLMATTGHSAMRDLRRDVFDHIQSLHLGFFDRFPVGRLVTRATNDIENVAEMFTAGIVAFVTDLIKMIGFAVALYWVDADLALLTFSVVPVLALGAVIFRFKVREAFRAVRVRIARINAHIQETITGMKVVQLFTREERNLRYFMDMNADHRDAWKQSIRYDALLFASVEATQGVTVAVIIWYGTGGLVEAGILYVFIDWMRRFFMPLRDLSAKYSVMQSAMASSERILQLLETSPEIADPVRPALPERAVSESGQGDGGGDRRGSVEFENVWFGYPAPDSSFAPGFAGELPGARKDDEPGETGWVLRDVSFRAEPGDRIAFVGATGAGKTTIIKLLTRLYEVSRGCIRVDGVDIREIPQHDLRRRVATVLQDVFLFSGSVADNIALGRSDIDREAIVEATRAVEMDRFIEALPEAYDTPVRERGTNFSAGQRQLLSFARALVHGADILVLDEATSSIDTQTEALVQHGIRVLMEGRTAIAVAHRLSTIRDMDCIYVLHHGQIVESGRHADLLRAGGVYHRLYLLQHEPQADPGVALATA
jgi:ATP-binding cassette subfamily B multidrug efflux pump